MCLEYTVYSLGHSRGCWGGTGGLDEAMDSLRGCGA